MKILLIIALLLAAPVFAHDYHDQPAQTTIINGNESTEDGVALSLAASGHQFDWSTNKLQGSLSGSQYDGRQGLSYAMALKPCKTCPLLSGAISTAGSKKAFVYSGSWRF